MNWKAIFALSTYGIVIAIGLGLGYIPETSLLFRIGIPFSLSLWIGTKIHRKQFLHGFLVGLIGESAKWVTVFFFFHTYIVQKLPGALEAAQYFWLLMILYSIHIGVWVGFFSWITADLKPYAMSIVNQIKEKKPFLSIKLIFYTIASLLSFFASVFCFFMLLSSCTGHGPRIYWLGIWIIPISALGAGGFYHLGKLLLKLSFHSHRPET